MDVNTDRRQSHGPRLADTTTFSDVGEPISTPEVAEPSFDGVAVAYDDGRPNYPVGLVDAILGACDRPVRDVLEIGAGTGKATSDFASKDLRITAIEPSADMLERARRSLPRGHMVSLVLSSLETWPVSERSFDLAFSAQAWHWVEPVGGYQKIHRALRPGGLLALYWSRPAWEEWEAGEELAKVYRCFAPELAGDAVGPWFPASTRRVTQCPSEEGRSALFGEWQRQSFRWTETYSYQRLADLLLSLPEHGRLSFTAKTSLLAAVQELVGLPSAISFELELYMTRPRGQLT